MLCICNGAVRCIAAQAIVSLLSWWLAGVVVQCLDWIKPLDVRVSHDCDELDESTTPDRWKSYSIYILDPSLAYSRQHRDLWSTINDVGSVGAWGCGQLRTRGACTIARSQSSSTYMTRGLIFSK